MGFIEKITSFFVGKNDKKVKEEPTEGNSISNQATLMNAIEKVLRRNYKGQNSSFDNKILKIWITDGLQYDSLKDSEFTYELRYFLDNQMGIIFSSIELHPGPLPESKGLTKVIEKVYVEISTKKIPNKSGRAEISIMNNYGSLKKEKYILDSEEIETLPSRRYNIGVGEYPDLNGRFRFNHIAVDDDPGCSGFERNKYVSRTHAYIRFSAGDGFLLQAEPEGTTKAGMRTRILRADSVIDVDDIVAQPLKDGDCIELSRNVRLIFKTISE